MTARYNYLSNMRPGTKASTVATMIDNLPVLHTSMIQRGVLADSTTALQFVDWEVRKKTPYEHARFTHDKLIPGRSYDLQGIKVSEFRGMIEVNLVYAQISETPDLGLDIDTIKKGIPLQWRKCHNRKKGVN